ncbi:hypothetical protein ABEW77_15525 [Heyndrickxia sporothermodurans]|uniref:hypothetical protein n=2 Tax=Heyndrickxia sporothermodurans TaxID=46224 RepID=UPI003D1CA9D2
MLYDFKMSKKHVFDYGDIRLSRNQIKHIFYQNLQSIQRLTINFENETIFLTKDEIIEIIMTKVQRREVIKIIHMISLIKNRQSDVSGYLKYILIGIPATNE